jgi:indolepyruvate ferredoxin oxidoreductase beta subunit
VLPGFLGRILGGSKLITTLIDRLTSEGRVVETTSIHGFLLLYCVAHLRRWRRSSARFAQEQKQIRDWLGLVMKTAETDYDLAIELAELRGLVKGYGDTHASSLEKYNTVMHIVPLLKTQDAVQTLKAMRKAAQTDDGGAALGQLVQQIINPTHS